MFALVGLLALVVFGLLGLVAWAGAERPLAMREIALNTRKEGAQGSAYPGLQMLGTLMKVLAIVTWVAGFIVAILAVVGGARMFEMFF